MIGLIIGFIISGCIYIGIEVYFDNTSHRSMGLVGGLIFTLCRHFDEWLGISIEYPKNFIDWRYWALCLVISVVIIALEYIAGLIWNKDYEIWDYRNMRYHLNGQICLTFFLVWFLFISHVIIYVGNIFDVIGW